MALQSEDGGEGRKLALAIDENGRPRIVDAATGDRILGVSEFSFEMTDSGIPVTTVKETINLFRLPPREV